MLAPAIEPRRVRVMPQARAAGVLAPSDRLEPLAECRTAAVDPETRTAATVTEVRIVSVEAETRSLQIPPPDEEL